MKFDKDVLPEVPGWVLQDLQTRVRQIESSIPPRVQEVENAVKTIEREFRELREEQLRASKKADENFKNLSTKLDATMEDLTERLSVISLRFARWAGAIAAVGGIMALLVTHGHVIIPAVQRVMIG